MLGIATTTKPLCGSIFAAHDDVSSRRSGQVVRHRFAKPTFAGSIPASASITTFNGWFFFFKVMLP